jgi:hypothetical protein
VRPQWGNLGRGSAAIPTRLLRRLSQGARLTLRPPLARPIQNRGFADREHRLAWTRRTIGRPIESANELTVGEASIVILALEAQGLHPEDA